MCPACITTAAWAVAGATSNTGVRALRCSPRKSNYAAPSNASPIPGRDPSIAPDPMPLWTILDMTPEGRGTDWYSKLEYGS